MQQSEAVTVDAAAASLSDIPATTDSSAKFAALLPELPSHLETVSSISNGMATVAVDAGGTSAHITGPAEWQKKIATGEFKNIPVTSN